MNNSKYLSFLLRHKPEQANLKLDDYGWCLVEELLENLKITKSELDHIVEKNNKKRFRYNKDKTKIKANQGHSIPIKDDFPQQVPPEILYHGTSVYNLTNIKSSGLKKMKRNHVHLSGDKETAIVVGMRYAKHKSNLIILEIQAKLMNNKGYKFLLSDNNVWLIDHVPSIFIN